MTHPSVSLSMKTEVHLKFIINHALLMIWSLFVEQKTHLKHTDTLKKFVIL